MSKLTSELIVLLQEAVEGYGDRELKYVLPDGAPVVMDGVYHHEDDPVLGTCFTIRETPPP